MALSSSCPGARMIREVRPEDVRCPGCGAEVEVWSDELMARCLQCGRMVARERSASCIDWCAHAAECVGVQTLRRLKGESG
jgi:Zn finger protein HypA/HybF involved in hydrogenase expression